MAAIMEKLGGRRRMYLVVMADGRVDLHRQIDHWLPALRQLRSARRVRWAVDMDPQEL